MILDDELRARLRAAVLPAMKGATAFISEGRRRSLGEDSSGDGSVSVSTGTGTRTEAGNGSAYRLMGALPGPDSTANTGAALLRGCAPAPPGRNGSPRGAETWDALTSGLQRGTSAHNGTTATPALVLQPAPGVPATREANGQRWSGDTSPDVGAVDANDGQAPLGQLLRSLTSEIASLRAEVAQLKGVVGAKPASP